MLVLLSAGGALAVPASRHLIVEQVSPLMAHVERMGGAPPTPAGQPAADSASAAASDDSLSSGANSGVVPERDSVVRASPLSGGEEIRAIPLDTSLYGGMRTPFRRAPAVEYGYVRVLIKGGFAPAIVDGQRVGMTPAVARLETGSHLVTVLGAGTSFLPNQVEVNVTANDTVLAVFTAPTSPTTPSPEPARDDSTRADTAHAAPPKPESTAVKP
jgi:hypothetical protein